MKCLSCGLEAGFTRLVVNVETAEKEGSLCSNCESKLSRISRREHSADPDDTHACLECDANATFALPEMNLALDEDDGEQFSYEFEIETDTPHLCTSHLEALLQQPRQVDPLNMLEEEI